MIETKNTYDCDGFFDEFVQEGYRAMNKIEFMNDSQVAIDAAEATRQLEEKVGQPLRYLYFSVGGTGEKQVLRLTFGGLCGDYDDLLMDDDVNITTTSIFVNRAVKVGCAIASVSIKAKLSNDIKHFLRANGNLGPSYDTTESIQCNV